jgi:hypothetical protein
MVEARNAAALVSAFTARDASHFFCGIDKFFAGEAGFAAPLFKKTPMPVVRGFAFFCTLGS